MKDARKRRLKSVNDVEFAYSVALFAVGEQNSDMVRTYACFTCRLFTRKRDFTESFKKRDATATGRFLGYGSSTTDGGTPEEAVAFNIRDGAMAHVPVVLSNMSVESDSETEQSRESPASRIAVDATTPSPKHDRSSIAFLVAKHNSDIPAARMTTLATEMDDRIQETTCVFAQDDRSFHFSTASV